MIEAFVTFKSQKPPDSSPPTPPIAQPPFASALSHRQGCHTHSINIQTSASAAQPHVLKITADLPAATAPLASPRELPWTHEPYAPRAITLVCNNLPSPKLAASCDSERFELRLDDSVRPALLHVTPRAGTGAARAEITLTATPENAPPATLKTPPALISLKGRREKYPYVRSKFHASSQPRSTVAYPISKYVFCKIRLLKPPVDPELRPPNGSDQPFRPLTPG